MTSLLQALLRAYQFFRQGQIPRCRFYPSCSEYAHEALSVWGFWRGSAKVIRRLLSCHPWHSGGYDPVTHL